MNDENIQSETLSLDDLMSNASPSLVAALTEAKNQKRQGESSAAMDLLKDLADMYPTEKVVFILLGHLYWEEDDLIHAQCYFQKATELDPSLEVASLGLYHTLWSSGLREEALEEMKRFIQISRSDEYDSLLQAFRECKDEDVADNSPPRGAEGSGGSEESSP